MERTIELDDDLKMWVVVKNGVCRLGWGDSDSEANVYLDRAQLARLIEVLTEAHDLSHIA
jgi:hypothetical protein